MLDIPSNISTYLQTFGPELGERVVTEFPPRHSPGDAVWPELTRLKRQPFPAQTMAIMGIVKRWEEHRAAAVVAECGTGKTLISLGSVFTHARGRRFTALAMAPPMLQDKWCREAMLTLPGVRVFVIDGVRNGTGSNGHTGVNEVRLRNGRIVGEGIRTTLSEMRLARHHRSAHARWVAQVGAPSIFVLSRERAKLGYFWRHAFGTPQSGPYLGSVVNPDTGRPVSLGDEQLRRGDFKRAKLSEQVMNSGSPKDRRAFFSALWQADQTKIPRMAPAEFIGRYMDGFFDYFIADEVHELKSGETAQGNALGILAEACRRTVALTGTLLGGYADELFFLLHRLSPRQMREDGFERNEAGVRAFAESYGVLEKITTIEPADNARSKGKTSVVLKRRPGASPLLFGRYLMNLAAFVSLEDIATALPPFHEEVIAVEMDPLLRRAYQRLEEQTADALRQHPGNSSVISTAMNALLLYPDRPFGIGPLYGFESNEDGQRERFLIAEPEELDESVRYAKERRLIEAVQADLSVGRAAMIFATYTQKRDVTRRMARLLAEEDIRCEVLTADVPPEQREAWFEKKLRQGMQVCICHPRLVQTGLDALWAKSIYFMQTGYSIYVLRQASRRSWRIGQRDAVHVRYLAYAHSAQERCLRLMGRKLLVSMAMEGKLEGGGLQGLDGDDGDMLTALARELVTKGVGESAAAVWRELQQLHPVTAGLVEPVVAEAVEPSEAFTVEDNARPWHEAVREATQLSLF